MEVRVHEHAVYLDFRDLPGERFEIYRSTRDIGEFELLTVTHQPFYVDQHVNLMQVELTYYYKVRTFDGDVQKETPVVTYVLGGQDNVARKIIREYATLLRVMKNPPLYLLAKRRQVAKCPECWNPVTRKVRYAGCKVCNGTGELAGYHAPTPVTVSRDLSAFSTAMMPEDIDKVRLSPISGWMAGVPAVMVDDIFVDTQGQRYRIMNVERRMKSQSIIRQTFSAVPLEKGHPSYLIPIPEEQT